MSDKDDDDTKPDLKVVSLDEKREEQEAIQELLDEDLLDFTKRTVNAYAVCRSLFSEIPDPFIETEAVHHLRKAFLLAINPLQQIDDQFDFIFEDDYDE